MPIPNVLTDWAHMNVDVTLDIMVMVDLVLILMSALAPLVANMEFAIIWMDHINVIVNLVSNHYRSRFTRLKLYQNQRKALDIGILRA